MIDEYRALIRDAFLAGAGMMREAFLTELSEEPTLDGEYLAPLISETEVDLTFDDWYNKRFTPAPLSWRV